MTADSRAREPAVTSNCAWEKVQAGIRTTLVAGPGESDSTDFILRLLKGKPPEERWAILSGRYSSRGAPTHVLQRAADPTVFVKSLEGGCLCCGMAPLMQQALNQLLHSSRPHCLLIELSDTAHVDKVLRVLAQPWYAKLLSVNVALVSEDDRPPQQHSSPSQGLRNFRVNRSL